MRTPAANEARTIRATWLRRFRIAGHFTQGELAEAVGVSANQVSRYERARDDPSLDVLDRLLVVLGCSYEDLHSSPGKRTPQIIPINLDKCGFYSRQIGDRTFNADAQTKALCGLSADAPTSLAWQCWFNNVHADDIARVQAELARLEDRHDGVFNTRYRLTGWDGAERQIIDYGCMIFDKAGQPLRLQGMMLDITREPRTQNTEEKIASILIAAKRRMGAYCLFIPALCHMLEYF